VTQSIVTLRPRTTEVSVGSSVQRGGTKRVQERKRKSKKMMMMRYRENDQVEIEVTRKEKRKRTK